jgi:hypothetical protein
LLEYKLGVLFNSHAICGFQQIALVKYGCLPNPLAPIYKTNGRKDGIAQTLKNLEPSSITLPGESPAFAQMLIARLKSINHRKCWDSFRNN